MIDKKQIVKYVTEVIDHFQKLEEMYEEYTKLFGIDPGAPMIELMYKTFTLYQNSISKLIGDDEGWLDWYIWENDCGKDEHLVSISKWKKSKKIKNIKDLVEIIIYDSKKENDL